MIAERKLNMRQKTKKLVGIGLLTAIVVVLQALAVVIRPTGLFNISLVLVPIVVGAALYGYKAGAWLGAVFGIVVLFTDSAAFMAINVPGTILTVLIKGTLAGLVAGLVYLALEKKNRYVAVIAAAIACPVTNTGVFLLGCVLFFMDTINGWAAAAGYASAGAYMIGALVGVNFLIELAVNIVLSSVIVRIIRIGKNDN
ncbi:MAG: ECF transporter S component [Lachnospiraceae bacterium]|nr:ECF transporter S component [Lachnospiraceae bacterium]